jgi:hypothetical protein
MIEVSRQRAHLVLVVAVPCRVQLVLQLTHRHIRPAAGAADSMAKRLTLVIVIPGRLLHVRAYTNTTADVPCTAAGKQSAAILLAVQPHHAMPHDAALMPH